MTLPTTLDQWLAHCEQLHPKTIDMTLERVRMLCDRLGLRFAVPVVVVAGTNGKGSSCAMLEAIALQAGYRVGLYIKPHLVHFNERCRINGEMASDALLLELTRRLQMVLRGADSLARLGGDEFVVLMEQLKEESDALLDALSPTTDVPFQTLDV